MQMASPDSKEYVSSEHRGPGPLDPSEAKRVCQQASQHETHAKKQKIALDAVTSGVKVGMASVEAIGGKGLVAGFYYSSRHRYGKKGKEIPDSTKAALATVFGDDWENVLESSLRGVVPKYDPNRADTVVGTNLSPACMSPQDAVKTGLKSVLRNAVNRNIGMRISEAAVNLRQMVMTELARTHVVTDSVPPTEDEILAAMTLAIQYSRHNLQVADPEERIPVNKYQDE